MAAKKRGTGGVSRADQIQAGAAKTVTTTTRLWLGFAALTALLVLFGALIFVRLQSLEQNIHQLAEVARPRSDSTRELKLNVLNYAVNRGAHLADGPGRRPGAKVAAAEVDRHLADYELLAETPRQRELAAHFAADWRELYSLGERLADTLRATPEEEERFVALRIRLEEFLNDEMQRDAVESYSARKETAYRDIRATVGFLLMLTAGGVVATLLTSVTVGRSIIRTENALCERTERYELVAAGAGDAIWDWDVKNHRVCFSPRWSELRGFAPDEVGDREEEWSSGIHPEDVSRVMAAVQAHFEGKTGFFAEEYRVRCKDGSWKWVLDRGIARRDAAGCVDRMAGSESDISQRKDAENALRESERFARSTLDGLSAHIAILDESGTILAVNRPWRAFAAANRPANSRDWGNVEEGANYLSICEKSVGRFSDEGHAAAAGIRAVLTEMLPEFTMEYPCNGPAEERWFLMRVTPFPGDGPRRVVVAHENITKRKVLEREVVEIASLEQRRIGQDLHDSVGQELTALNILAGSLAKNLQTNPSSGPKLVERMVQGLQRSQKELRAVMRGLLPVAVDTEGLMAALSDLAGRIQQEQKATCEFECPEPVSVANNLTATHLYLIAQEAVHNAVKHARPGNIRIMLKANHVLSLSVQDDGIGVPARLTENHGGLGLRIMRNRAAIIGATLTIEPAKPTGTLVTCALDRKNEER